MRQTPPAALQCLNFAFRLPLAQRFRNEQGRKEGRKPGGTTSQLSGPRGTHRTHSAQIPVTAQLPHRAWLRHTSTHFFLLTVAPNCKIVLAFIGVSWKRQDRVRVTKGNYEQ